MANELKKEKGDTLVKIEENYRRKDSKLDLSK